MTRHPTILTLTCQILQCRPGREIDTRFPHVAHWRKLRGRLPRSRQRHHQLNLHLLPAVDEARFHSVHWRCLYKSAVTLYRCNFISHKEQLHHKYESLLYRFGYFVDIFQLLISGRQLASTTTVQHRFEKSRFNACDIRHQFITFLNIFFQKTPCLYCTKELTNGRQADNGDYITDFFNVSGT